MIRLTTASIAGWMAVVVITLGTLLSKQEDSLGTKMYRIGPHDDLYILGFAIDSPEKYWTLAIFCFANSGMRAINSEILRSWIINQVQDISKPTMEVKHIDAYIYVWFDFFMYMNILLTQIDMILIEVCADLTMTMVLTTYYCNRRDFAQ